MASLIWLIILTTIHSLFVNDFLHGDISEELDGNTDNDTPVPNYDETETEPDDEEEDDADDDNDDESNPIIDYIVLRGVSRIFIMGFPPARNYRNMFEINSDQLLTI